MKSGVNARFLNIHLSMKRGEECMLLHVKQVGRRYDEKGRVMIDVASLEQVMMVIDQCGWIKRMHCKESSFSAMMEVS